MLKYLQNLKSKTAPTFVLLHGFGSNKEDLFGLHPYFDDFNMLCFEAPISLGMGGYAWYPIDWSNGNRIIEPEDVQKACSLVAESIQNWRLEHQIEGPLILGGFSQGAITSLRMALNGFQADAFVLMSGTALPEWYNELSELNSLAPTVQTHGTSDPVLPFEWAEATAKGLSHLKNYRFHSYPMANNS
jgi:phospholipase/carboxylesterase